MYADNRQMCAYFPVDHQLSSTTTKRKNPELKCQIKPYNGQDKQETSAFLPFVATLQIK